MSNLAKLDFKALAVNGENYLSWQLDVKIHLQSKKLGDTIIADNNMKLEDKASATDLHKQNQNVGKPTTPLAIGLS